MNEATSPIPKKEDTSYEKAKEIDFSSAIKEIIVGKKITKLEWCNKEIFGYLKDERLMLRKNDGKDYHWIISEVDLVGSDYMVIN